MADIDWLIAEKLRIKDMPDRGPKRHTDIRDIEILEGRRFPGKSVP